MENPKLAGATRACREGRSAPASSGGDREDQLIKLSRNEQQNMLLVFLLLLDLLLLRKLLLNKLLLKKLLLKKLLFLLSMLRLIKLPPAPARHVGSPVVAMTA